MSRLVKLWCVLAAGPLAAGAQTRNLQGRARGEPTGIAIPDLSVAGAEEPTALEVNPAGIGFVDGLTFQYFHEGRGGTGLGGDGFWLATPVGPLVPALSMQWIRPADGGGARFRKTTLGLAVPRSQALSLALAVNWYSSPFHDLDQLWSLDAGLTIRPWRHLSLGASILGMNASLVGRRLPTRYQLGAATRVWDDRVTLSADLLADDRAANALTVLASALGASAEIVPGVAFLFQVQFPVHGGLSGPDGSTYGQLALRLDGAHAGVTAGGGTGDGAERTWLLGARLSAQRYRAARLGTSAAPSVDLAESLARPRSLLFHGAGDPYGTLLDRLTAARDDPSSAALAVRIDSLPVGQGRVDELRSLLLEVKRRKPVAAYLVGGSMKEYYLASAATVLLAPPSADLFPAGLSSTSFFVRDALGKLGVTFDVVAAGRYKTAPDPLIRQDMSEAQRESSDAILDDVFARQVRGIAEARRLPEERVRALIDVGVFSAEQAVAAGLVDATAWPDEVGNALSQRAGQPVHLVRGWDRSKPRAADRWGPRKVIALVRLEGVIATGKNRSDPLGALAIAGADTVVRLLQRATEDDEVVAIVLRVDSPGGDALASDLIWREVMRARRAGKPVVVSMGDVAASGGYLASVAADAILAEPSTLTGSIGVFTVKPDLSGLLARIGVSDVTLKRGEHADLRTPTRRWTADERRLVAQQVQAFYELFLDRVAAGRKIAKDDVERVAAGRVWTGAQARERGLIDGIGSLEDAVRLARERAGYSPGAELGVRRFEPPRSLLGDLGRALGTRAESPLLSALDRIPEVRGLTLLQDMGSLVALPPEWLGVVEADAASP